MNTKRPFILLAISFLTAITLFFFDEGYHSFDFLINSTELKNLFVMTILVSVAPLVIYLFTVESKFKHLSFRLSLLGYLPAMVLLLIILIA
jgi:hypothetical protein